MLISFSGAQSTGKTTLIKHLKKLNPEIDFEYEIVRSIKKNHGVDISECGTEETQYLVAGVHVDNIKKYKKGNKSMIVDRCMVDCLSYAYWSYYTAETLSKKCVQDMCKIYFETVSEYDIIFLMDHRDVKLVEDGERSNDNAYRDEIISLFIYNTEALPNVVLLSGTVDERLKAIKQALKERELYNINI